MAKNQESINRSLFELLRSRGYAPTLLDTSGKEIPVPEEAEVFQFKFSKDGEEYGTVTASIDGLHKLVIYFGDDVANSEKEVSASGDDSWYKLLNHLKRFAQQHQLSFEVKNRDHLKYDMAKREHMKKQERISEGYHPMGKKASYNDNIPTVKIVIEHTRQIEEGEQRYRNVNRIFLENTQGERILAPTTKPGVAQVYARHLAEGGMPHDDRWNHIISLCEEYNKMGAFVRATRNNQFNESAQQLVNEGINHYQSLRESLSKMRGARGYNSYFESYTPPLMEDETEENNLNELFVQETLDPRIESVMPILNKLHKKVAEMKEVNELSEWADNLIESDLEEGDGGQQAINPMGVPEGKGPLGQGDLGLALKSLGGSWSSWHEENSHDPDIEVYEYDDGEGGYYASGSIEHNLKTGEIEVHYQDGENDVDVDGTFNSIGDAMKALRGGNSYPSWGGKKPNFDRLGQRKQHGPDDLRKTDRTGRKGTLAGGPTNSLKQNIQWSKGKHGPKGVLPEDDAVDEGMMDTVKKVGSKVFDKLGGGSEEDLIRDLQKSAGVTPTGKKPEFDVKAKELARSNPSDPAGNFMKGGKDLGIFKEELDEARVFGYDIKRVPDLKVSHDDAQELKNQLGMLQKVMMYATPDDMSPEIRSQVKNIYFKITNILQRNGLQESDLMSMEEALDPAQAADQKIKTPAVHRKEQGGDWKVNTQDLAKADEKNMTSTAGMAALKKKMSTMEENQLDEIGDTPAGREKLEKYINKADLQLSQHWADTHDKGHLPTDQKMAKRNSGTLAANKRLSTHSNTEKELAENEFAGDYATGEAGQWRNKGPKAHKPATIGDLVGEGVDDLARILNIAGIRK